MKSLPRGLIVVGSVAALAGACGGGGLTAPYEGARGPKRNKTDVPVYEIDCKDQVQSTADCTYSGGPLAFKMLGIFRVPSKAVASWGKYRVKVIETAANNGCPAVAIRKIPPSSSDGNAVGAFCVDPNAAEMATGGPDQGGPQQGGAGISVTASATIAPPVIECNAPSDCPPGMKCTRGQCTP